MNMQLHLELIISAHINNQSPDIQDQVLQLRLSTGMKSELLGDQTVIQAASE